jgi:hypothetical protein
MADWQTEALPVLATVYRQTERSEIGVDVSSRTVAEELGREPGDQRTLRTLWYLKEDECIDGEQAVSQSDLQLYMRRIVMKPKGLQHAAGWPGNPEAAASSFLTFLEEAIANAEPEERNRLQGLLDSAREVGLGGLAAVLGRVLWTADGGG